MVRSESRKGTYQAKLVEQDNARLLRLGMQSIHLGRDVGGSNQGSSVLDAKSGDTDM